MYRLEREEFVQPHFVSLWSLLAFQAGFINAFGFLACGRFVSHVTGFGTQIGVALAEQRLLFAIEMLGFPLSFILGSFTSGFITIAKIEQGRRPRFDAVVAMLPVVILCLAIAGHLGAFGPFGEQLVRPRDFTLLFLLSFMCGMQNGCFATLTKGQIRTTHLTGISTDIGTDLARIWFGKLSPEELELTRRTNFSRLMTFMSFTAGSIASVAIAPVSGYWALLVPLATSLFVLAAVRMVGRLLDQRFSPQAQAQPAV